jgi:Arc/MetJ family transcription regulator
VCKKTVYLCIYKKGGFIMRTNIEIDDNLIKNAMDITKIKTKKGVVSYALKELINLHKRKSILKYKGKLKWEGNLDEMRQI